MIRQTINPEIIRRYLDDDGILSGFNGGDIVDDLDIENAIYLYCEGVGLFPVRIRNGVASIHAAIPESNRGKRAVKAGKMAISWLKQHGYFVTCRVAKDRFEVMLFASLCGFKRIEENEDFIIYMA